MVILPAYLAQPHLASRPAAKLTVPARVLRGAMVTAAGCPVATMVCVQARDMKQPWCLAASVTNETARALISLYGKRWGIERLINRLKQFRRIATRYEKRGINYLAMVTLGMILLWL